MDLSRLKKRWRRYAGAAAVVLVAGATGVVTYVGGSSAHNPVPGLDSVQTLLSLDADTDFPALSDRTTFCSGADHCWLFGGSGTISDSGSGSWDLTASGSPRTGIETGLPTYDGNAVSWTGEQSFACDASLNNYTATQDQPAADLVSVSAVYQVREDSGGNRGIAEHRGTTGWVVSVVGGAIWGRVYGAVTDKTVTSTGISARDGGWYCLTVVLDSRSANAGRIYANGADVTNGTDLSGAGSWAQAAAPLLIGKTLFGHMGSGQIARVRVDYSALSLSDHQALCGSWGAAIRRDHAAYADVTYTRSGGTMCTPTSATTAVCTPGGNVPYYWDGTDRRVLIDGGGRINRLVQSATPDCTNWTCATATAAASVAPDGSKTAQSYTMGGGTVTSPTATGYTNGATLYPAVWVKCSSGTLTIDASVGTGDWDVACATIGGAWTLIKSASHAAVTQNTAWTASGTGTVDMRFGGADAEVWMPSLTETADPVGVVVPTGAAAVDTATGVWTIANATGSYWATGDTVTTDVTEHSGTCWVTGSTLRLSGAGGSECAGGWQSLLIER